MRCQPIALRSYLAALFVVFSITLTACDGGASAPVATSVPTAAVPGSTQSAPTSTISEGGSLPAPTIGSEEKDLFEVVSPTTYLAANGELHVAGIINYKGTTQRVRPEVTAHLKDEAGTSIMQMPASSLPTLIKPQSIIPYSVRFTTPPAKWARLDMEVTAAEATELDFAFHYADFETQQTEIEMPPAQEAMRPVRVAGTVKNTGSRTASNIKVAVALYYADGRVADVVATGTMEGTLAPGESSAFSAESIFATFEKQQVTRIEAVASAMVDE